MHCNTIRTQLQSGTRFIQTRLASLFYPGGLQYGMPPLASLRRRRHSVIWISAYAWLSFCSACSTTDMQVDGQFNDWSNPTSRTQVVGSELWVDIRTPGPPVNLQQLTKPMTLELQLDDGMQQTIELTFSPLPRSMGVELAILHADGTREIRSPYELDVSFAPTIAANRFELAIDLASVTNGPVRGRLHGLDVHDQVEFFLNQPSQYANPTAHIPPSDDGSMRIVSWNVQFGTLLKKPLIAARLLRAMAPDVLLLQELEDEQTTQGLCAFLNATLGTTPHPWRAVASPPGSRLRSMVAARSHQPPPPMPAVVDRAGAPLRAAFMPITWGSKTWLAGSVHLRCCGGIGGPQDLERINESVAINDAIDGFIQTKLPAGIILGGDLNLVGSDKPLQILTTHRDLDGSDLHVANAMQLDQRSWATWSDDDSAFTPGRLDWLLYSGSALQQSCGFVLDTRDLAPSALDLHGLTVTDTAQISDHLPLVMDAKLH
ncbi:MAG: endonuclease/exonuclease/phosphatase family protein [Phycisphaerales bacterium]|nr:endonuclease/exonuclease/phosphatase family protein [Phycisphaerales bacterium]